MLKMYIPDAQKWTRFYHNIINNEQIPIVHRSFQNQRGGSISSTPSGYIQPIEQTKDITNIKTDTNQNLDIKLVSPSQQTLDQARSEVKRIKRPLKGKKKKKTTSKSKKTLNVTHRTSNLKTRIRKKKQKKRINDIFN